MRFTTSSLFLNTKFLSQAGILYTMGRSPDFSSFPGWSRFPPMPVRVISQHPPTLSRNYCAPPPALLIASRFITGFFSAAFHCVTAGTIGDLFTSSEIGK